jgi:hypothetical protein
MHRGQPPRYRVDRVMSGTQAQDVTRRGTEIQSPFRIEQQVSPRPSIRAKTNFRTESRSDCIVDHVCPRTVQRP